MEEEKGERGRWGEKWVERWGREKHRKTGGENWSKVETGRDGRRQRELET